MHKDLHSIDQYSYRTVLLFTIIWVGLFSTMVDESTAKSVPISSDDTRDLTSKISYSDEVSLKAIKELGWRVDPTPQQKIISKIHVVALPVFLEGERLSALTTPLNLIHTTTKAHIINRESRLVEGGAWSSGLALETERNLRSLGIFTSVRVLPVTRLISDSSDESSLDVVIVTRDLWSLRLESGFSYNGGILNSLNLSLTERNLLGRRILLSGVSAISPYNMVGGLVLNHRRFGPDLSLSANVSGTWTRGSREREGESAQLSISRPLFNLDQAWSFGASVGQGRQRARIGRGGVLLTDDDPSTLEVEETPIQWVLNSWFASLGATRQWSGQTQRRLSLNLGVSESRRTVLPGVSNTQEERWRTLYLPPDRFQVGPSLSFSWYKRRYIALTDISTYGLREDLRIGPSFSTSHQMILMGDRAYIPSLSLGYALPILNRGFVSASMAGSARVEGMNGDEVVNRVVSGAASCALPLRLFKKHRGFLVMRLTLSKRWADVSNGVITLGGDAGLRGYPNGAFTVIGGGVSRNNFEYRSPPLRWSFIHIGVALFYEGGSVYQTFDEYEWKHSVGGGIRLLFPQLNRSVFRIDLARPLSSYPSDLSTPPVVLSIGSAQGFWFMPWEG